MDLVNGKWRRDWRGFSATCTVGGTGGSCDMVIEDRGIGKLWVLRYESEEVGIEGRAVLAREERDGRELKG